jgi:DnaJ-class molecular chaperone
MAIHSHYDSLKVARNAPPEVIRAAYKALSHKWHPDRNGDTEAHK